MFRSLMMVCALSLFGAGAQASFLGRAASTPGGTDYQAYYDDVLDITWLADANYSKTSGYDADGLMNWSGAQAWAASLNSQNSGLGYLGVNNWRLPTTAQPDATCSSQSTWPPPYPRLGGGFGCTGSEMGHLANVDGISSSTPTPFSNIQSLWYWTGTQSALFSTVAWRFHVDLGLQDSNAKTEFDYAWAVSSGDSLSAVPVPAAVWLFCSALGVMGWVRRKPA